MWVHIIFLFLGFGYLTQNGLLCSIHLSENFMISLVLNRVLLESCILVSCSEVERNEQFLIGDFPGFHFPSSLPSTAKGFPNVDFFPLQDFHLL